MIDYAGMLREWHEKFDVPINEKPTLLSVHRANLRVNLIQEELDEFDLGTFHDDLVEIADGLGDLLYVVFGAVLEYGIPIERVFTEIHRSNMTKVWPDGHVHRNAAGKIIKPPTYSPADIKSIIDAAINEVV